MNADHLVLPFQLVTEVEAYIDHELDAAEKYDNSEPFDEDGVYRLHRLAAAIYARGWQDGAMAERQRDEGVRRRERRAASEGERHA